MDKIIPLEEDILDFTPEKFHCVPIAGSWQSDLELVDLRKQRVCINKSRTLSRNKHKGYLWWCQHITEQSSGTEKHQCSSETSSCVRTSLCLAPWHVAEPPCTRARTSQPRPIQFPVPRSSLCAEMGLGKPAEHLQPLCCSELPSVWLLPPRVGVGPLNCRR